MSTLYAAQLGPGYLQTLPNPAYDFGTGDFTVSASIMGRQAGVLVSRKGPDDESGGGFVLAVGSDGSITFTTYAGSASFYGTTAATSILDGDCHSVIAIRQGPRIEILIDGTIVTTTTGGSGAGPLNVDNSLSLTIGYSQRSQQNPNQFRGVVMNVGIWSSALSGEALPKAQFARVEATDPDLQGYWTLDASSEDLSSNANPADIIGPVSFVPCISCVWASGPHGYEFCQMANIPQSTQLEDLAAGGELMMSRELEVPSGAVGLCGGIMGTGESPEFPAGATVSIVDPSGKSYTQDTNTEDVFVKTVNGQPWGFAIVDPAPGIWRLSVTAPPSTSFVLSLNTIPTEEVVASVKETLLPIYGPDQTLQELESDMLGSWFSVFVGIAVAAVVVGVAVAAVMWTGGAATPAIVAVAIRFAAVAFAAGSAALMTVDTENLSTASEQIGGMSGFITSQDTVLLVDQNTDMQTEPLYRRRKKKLYAQVTASKFKSKEKTLVGSQDTRANLSAALLGFNSGLLSICGHGRPSYITGWYVSGTSGPYSEVLSVGQYQPGEAAGKIVHHLGCNAGASLGPDLVCNGAIAFFGYSKPYCLALEEQLLFIDCDLAIDLALLEEKTCDEAYSASIAATNAGISRLRANANYTAAAALEENRDNLVAPSTDAAYGSKTAHLE